MSHRQCHQLLDHSFNCKKDASISGDKFILNIFDEETQSDIWQNTLNLFSMMRRSGLDYIRGFLELDPEQREYHFANTITAALAEYDEILESRKDKAANLA
jgi:hypothetical protein